MSCPLAGVDVCEMHADPRTRARDIVVEVGRPAAARIETLGVPVKLAHTYRTVRRPAPRLGEHTAEVQAETRRAQRGD